MRAKPTFIITGDWHLQDSSPVCRLDNFRETQKSKLQFISELSDRYRCSVIHSGDLFDYWKASPELLTFAFKYLPNDFRTIYGNHDLPQHNFELAYKSGIATMEEANRLQIPPGGFHWGKEPDGETFTLYENRFKRKIAVWHVFTFQGTIPWPGCTSLNAKQILKKYPMYDLIITGDNHETFVEKYRGRLLVNPGSIFRLTAKQVNHKPCVFLYYAETNTVKPVYIPIEENVISREHIEKIEQRDNRIDAFISSLTGEFNAGLNFKENLIRFYHKNKTEQDIINTINKFLEI